MIEHIFNPGKGQKGTMEITIVTYSDLENNIAENPVTSPRPNDARRLGQSNRGFAQHSPAGRSSSFPGILRRVSDDNFVFREQRDNTTEANVAAGCSPAVESVFACAQPKIYALLRLVAYAGPDADDAVRRRGEDDDDDDVGHGDDVENRDDDGDDDGDDDACEKTVRACGLVAGLEDKATVAHVYHYYSLKLGEVWNENRLLLSSQEQQLQQLQQPQHPPPSVESQSVAVMTARRAYLTALIRSVRSRVADLHQRASDSVRRPVIVSRRLVVTSHRGHRHFTTTLYRGPLRNVKMNENAPFSWKFKKQNRHLG